MRIFNKKNQSKKRFYYLNERINSSLLRVIDENGNQLGIISKEEALKKAYEQEADLVLIAEKANPPVAKIIDFKKFLYQQEKKEKEAKKGVKKGVVKDIQLSLFIGPADFDRLVKKGESFLNEGHQLRLSLTLKGREIAKKQMGFDLINRYLNNLSEINIAKAPKLEGRVIRVVVSKKK